MNKKVLYIGKSMFSSEMDLWGSLIWPVEIREWVSKPFEIMEIEESVLALEEIIRRYDVDTIAGDLPAPILSDFLTRGIPRGAMAIELHIPFFNNDGNFEFWCRLGTTFIQPYALLNPKLYM